MAYSEERVFCWINFVVIFQKEDRVHTRGQMKLCAKLYATSLAKA